MKAERRIFVSCDDYETRVAIFENSKLAEYFFERKTQERNQGNIYKGRVTTIVPGIEAAFVDIGLPKKGFLYLSEIEDAFESDEPSKRTKPFEAKKGQVLRFTVEADRFGSAVDPSLIVLSADGKELARNDDVPGTSDASPCPCSSRA